MRNDDLIAASLRTGRFHWCARRCHRGGPGSGCGGTGAESNAKAATEAEGRGLGERAVQEAAIARGNQWLK